MRDKSLMIWQWQAQCSSSDEFSSWRRHAGHLIFIKLCGGTDVNTMQLSD